MPVNGLPSNQSVHHFFPIHKKRGYRVRIGFSFAPGGGGAAASRQKELSSSTLRGSRRCPFSFYLPKADELYFLLPCRSPVTVCLSRRAPSLCELFETYSRQITISPSHYCMCLWNGLSLSHTGTYTYILSLSAHPIDYYICLSHLNGHISPVD